MIPVLDIGSSATKLHLTSTLFFRFLPRTYLREIRAGDVESAFLFRRYDLTDGTVSTKSVVTVYTLRHRRKTSVLVIRKDQYAVLEQSVLERWLAHHLSAHFPGLREMYPGEQLHRFIRDGISRARVHGFSTGPQLAHWLNLTALLGPRFDEDPKNAWAPEILSQSEPSSIKLRALIRAAEIQVWGAVRA